MRSMMRLTMRSTMRSIPTAAGVLALALAGGCMPDSILAEREETAARLRAESRSVREHVARLADRKVRLEALIRSGKTLGGAAGLLDDLRTCGFALENGPVGTMRLRLSGPIADGPGRLRPLAASRLARAATLLSERLPGHELSVESADLARAVAAVRVLHEDAGVPGPRLRASTGAGPDVVLEVRPTRAETLQEVIAATAD